MTPPRGSALTTLSLPAQVPGGTSGGHHVPGHHLPQGEPSSLSPSVQTTPSFCQDLTLSSDFPTLPAAGGWRGEPPSTATTTRIPAHFPSGDAVPTGSWGHLPHPGSALRAPG